MKSVIIVPAFILCLIVLPSVDAATRRCEGLLGGLNSGIEPPSTVKPLADSTDGFIYYLGQLLEKQIISESEIKELIKGIETRNEIVNPIPHEVTPHGVVLTKSAYQIHYDELDFYIQHSNSNQKQILEWALKTSKETDRIHERRDETRQETHDVFQKMEFHRIEAGSFVIDHSSKAVNVTLTHPFEAMSTLVTQKMWVDEMAENPAYFQNGENSVTVNSPNGRQVKMQPDNPIESITWWSAMVFANRLSEKMSLKPVYDLRKLKFKVGTSAEAGTLKPEDKSQRAAWLVKINAPGGNIYRAEGYRLPTEAELEYLLRDRGRSNTSYFTDVDKHNFRDYAWFNDNSDGRTHPVAQLAPFVIDGKDFYDLYGNVWEFTSDESEIPITSGTDPIGRSPYPNTLGGCILGPFSTSLIPDSVFPNGAAKLRGLRLVRTLKEPQPSGESTWRRWLNSLKRGGS